MGKQPWTKKDPWKEPFDLSGYPEEVRKHVASLSEFARGVWFREERRRNYGRTMGKIREGRAVTLRQLTQEIIKDEPLAVQLEASIKIEQFENELAEKQRRESEKG